MPRPSRPPATTRTSPTGSTVCRRRTASPTPSGSSRTPGAGSWPGERARLAVDRRGHRRAARQRQPRPLRRPRGGRDRLLGQAGGAPPGRGPGGGAPRHRLGVRRSRASSASSCSRTPATRRRRRWPAGSGSRASACCAASSRRSRARAGRGGSCRPRTAACRPATTRCSSCGCARTRRRRPDDGPGAGITRACAQREAPDLAEPAPLSGLSPERPFFDPANRLADEVTAYYSSGAGAQSSSCLDLLQPSRETHRCAFGRRRRAAPCPNLLSASTLG